MSSAEEGYVDWKGWKDEEFARVDKRHRRYFDWHLGRALQGRRPQAVLEIGFGNGAFLGHCREAGIPVWAVEADAALRARAERAGFPAADRVSALPGELSFDLIVLFDVLEHIPAEALVAFMRELRARLSPGGAVLLRVPNGDSPFGGRHQHGDLTHVTAFGEFKLRQLAQLAGLRLAAIGEAPWNAQRFEARNLRALLRAGVRRAIERIVAFAYFNRVVDLDSNLAAVLVADEPAPAGGA